ncbi:YraN family protein [Bacteroidales bacterium OttesenSCG-928-B11]|nr:YraN family protein [Bacteroidales bacterium OttesenSCG-928-E04]MDL2308247.1 YraN family protein [Bacteroidales bacterium OttesenSCG-928-C03]MDL2312875.1 YraN family protein [Bacteroidales bacterium OttesenSCG-928-B11]MDL2326219.1 YraN family protein [Bacteroidales bacterium OttesenSCG-928-A14]
MMNDKQKTGKLGEDLASDHLVKQQFTILEKNWRYGHLEIDIIAQNQKKIVFCEVKTRSSNKVLPPELAVTLQKQRNLIKAANHYLVTKQIQKEARFDIISILINGSSYQLNHIEDAFMPRW